MLLDTVALARFEVHDVHIIIAATVKAFVLSPNFLTHKMGPRHHFR
jgi:hypothetical protein